jgi:DNA polymerase-3 subunit gamma/tau
LNKDREKSLQDAMVKACGTPLQLEIRVGRPADETPAKARRRMEDERQQAAEAAIRNDPNVQTLVEQFGAKVNPESIRPKD